MIEERIQYYLQSGEQDSGYRWTWRIKVNFTYLISAIPHISVNPIGS